MTGDAHAHAYEQRVFMHTCGQWFAIALLTFNIMFHRGGIEN